MLQGILVKPLTMFADERGFFTEIFKSDWKDLFTDEIVQTNLSITYPGVVRAWHKHQRGQVDYFVVIRGGLKLCAFDEPNRDLQEMTLTENNPQIVRIPGNYWHGFKSIGDKPAYLVYFVNKHYNTEDPDEVRRPWNTPTINPQRINGRSDDSRCGKPWDWLAPPHK